MPVTLTIKNIPDSVYEALKKSAEGHRRSMNNEVIVCLEAVLRPNRPNVEERLAEIRKLRESIKGTFKPEDIDKFKRQGRP